MRISKFKGAETYWPWEIYVQVALEPRNGFSQQRQHQPCQKILRIKTPRISTLSIPKKTLILILRINHSIFIDKYTTQIGKRNLGLLLVAI